MKNVLIVDDDPFVGDQISRILERIGYRALTAASARDALALYSFNIVDIVITEIFMSDIDGFELIQDLLRMNPDCKIITMSKARPYFDYSTVARKLGALGSLEKPITMVELIGEINEVTNFR